MLKKFNLELQGKVRGLSEAGLTMEAIRKPVLMEGETIHINIIRNIIRGIGAECRARAQGKIYKKQQKRTKITKDIILCNDVCNLF